jgi:hypothetical protein
MRAALAACVVVILSSLGGCATPPPPMRYAHQSATQQTYMQDRFACIQQAQQNRSGAYVDQFGGTSQSKVVINRGVFLACMGAKGYKVDANGPLTTPSESVVHMVDD